MFKKIISFLLVFSMIFLLAVQATYAQSGDNITRNTVITEKNINNILNHYGIDPSTAIKKQQSSDSKAVVTVGELEDALKLLTKMPKSITINNNNELNTTNSISSTNNSSITNGITPKISDPFKYTGTKTLYATTSMGSYSIQDSVIADYAVFIYPTYTTKIWTGSNTPYVSLLGPFAPGNDFIITQLNALSSSYTSSTVTEHSNIVVTSYLVIGIKPFELRFKITDTTINSTNTWGTSSI